MVFYFPDWDTGKIILLYHPLWVCNGTATVGFSQSGILSTDKKKSQVRRQCRVVENSWVKLNKVRFEPSSNAFSEIIIYLNAASNATFSSAKWLNFELNFGPVLQSSGSNFGSGPDFGITSLQEIFLQVPLSKRKKKVLRTFYYLNWNYITWKCKLPTTSNFLSFSFFSFLFFFFHS